MDRQNRTVRLVGSENNRQAAEGEDNDVLLTRVVNLNWLAAAAAVSGSDMDGWMESGRSRGMRKG